MHSSTAFGTEPPKLPSQPAQNDVNQKSIGIWRPRLNYHKSKLIDNRIMQYSLRPPSRNSDQSRRCSTESLRRFHSDIELPKAESRPTSMRAERPLQSILSKPQLSPTIIENVILEPITTSNAVQLQITPTATQMLMQSTPRSSSSVSEISASLIESPRVLITSLRLPATLATSSAPST